MLIREVLFFTGLEVRTDLLLDIAAARSICRREGVRNIRLLSTQVLGATTVVETRSGHGWSVYIRREPSSIGVKVITCSQTATAEAVKRPGVGPK